MDKQAAKQMAKTLRNSGWSYVGKARIVAGLHRGEYKVCVSASSGYSHWEVTEKGAVAGFALSDNSGDVRVPGRIQYILAHAAGIA